MFLGFIAIGQLMKGEIVTAGWLIFFAGVMDAVDGKLARLIGIPSKFGTEFDSFADTISFCVAPSVLIYQSYVKGLNPILGGIIAFFPILFGTIRLARFNLMQTETPKSYFIGLPTPLNAMGLFGYALFSKAIYGHAGDPRIALVLAMVSGILMISQIRFGKVPILSLKVSPSNTIRLVSALGIMAVITVWRGLIIFPVFLIYTGWSIASWTIHPHRFEQDVIPHAGQKDE